MPNPFANGLRFRTRDTRQTALPRPADARSTIRRRWRAALLPLIALGLAGTMRPALRGTPTDAPPDAVRGAALAGLPLYFIENQGQVDERVALYVQGRDKSVYFTPQGLTFVLAPPGAGVNSTPTDRGARSGQPGHADDRYALRLDFVNADAAVRPEGRSRAEAVVSYFTGEPSQWKPGLPTYSEVVYTELWPGIDLVYAGTQDRLKYTFLVKPGADPSLIRLSYRGATSARINGAGELEVSSPGGGFHDAAPVSYQQIDGRRVDVATRYALTTDGTGAAGADGSIDYGFDVAGYDPRQPLVIDPTIFIYAGFIGGDDYDFAFDIAVGPSGGAYVTGYTSSTEASFPDGDGIGALPGYDGTFNGGMHDAYVAKVRADGTGLVYVSYLGGFGDDFGAGIAVGSGGNVFVVGSTDSPDFPTLDGPGVMIAGGQDAFITKLSASGTSLLYSGFIGGFETDSAQSVAVDSAGAAYVTGFTDSDETTFPVKRGPDLSYNGGVADAFVAKVRVDGTGLVYAGYIGGQQDEYGIGIAVDGEGAAYVTGYTRSAASFPVVVGPDLTYNGGSADGFVAKVNPGGTALVYAGYIGGERNDEGHDIAVDAAGAAYVTGETISDQNTFPVLVGPDLSYNGGFSDAFVAKVDAAGTALIYAGYIGGQQEDSGASIAVDAAGRAHVAGKTASGQATFPDGNGFGALSGPDVTYNGEGDGFAARVNAAGTTLLYATYIGGHEYDAGYGIAIDAAGNAYIAGNTQSPEVSFPDGDGFDFLPGPDQTFNNGTYDAFVVKIGPQN
jgi:hypothetical protein